MKIARWFVLAGILTALAVWVITTQFSDIARVRRANDGYRSVAAAEAAGYEKFLECFESPQGGMGQHYVNVAALDAEVDPLHPEAMVYAVNDGRLDLAAVEWVVPGSADDTPPHLFDQHFHYNGELEVWVLHAWLWERNPEGTFVDWNPNVGPCP